MTTDDDKQTVYAVRFSASLNVEHIYIIETEEQIEANCTQNLMGTFVQQLLQTPTYDVA